MTVDLRLDPATDDVDLSGGQAHLESDPRELLRQRVKARLATWRGEYHLDLDAGTAWDDVLGSKPDAERARRAATDAVLQEPGIARADLAIAFEAPRRVVITGSVYETTGEEVQVEVTV